MTMFDFLKYWLDTHTIIFGITVIILAMGISSMLSNLFYNKHKAKADSEHEKQFWGYKNKN